MLRMMRFVPLLSLVVLGCEGAPAVPEDDISAQQQEFAASTSNLVSIGHEHPLSYAINFTNADVRNSSFYWTPSPRRLACHENDERTTPYAMLQGNCHTDDPDVTLFGFYGVTDDTYKPLHRELHFMRNIYTDATGSFPEPVYAACEKGKAAIVAATREGMRLWNLARARAEFFLGHATHIIQDSFAKGHGARTMPPDPGESSRSCKEP